MTQIIQAISNHLTEHGIKNKLIDLPPSYTMNQYQPFIRIPTKDADLTWHYIYIDIDLDLDKSTQQLHISTLPNTHPRTLHLANPKLLQQLMQLIQLIQTINKEL